MTPSGVLRIRSIERLRTSVKGNARWRLWVDTAADRRPLSLNTKVDASVGYDLSNAEWLNCPVRLDLDGRGQVYGIEHALLTQDHPPDAAGRTERPDDEIDLTSYRVRTANAIAGTL